MAVKSPSVAGIRTDFACADKSRRSGDTRSNCIVSAILSSVQTGGAAGAPKLWIGSGSLGSQFLSLGDHVFDTADHVEGSLWEVIVFTGHNRLEGFDRVLKRNLNTVRPCEYLRHIERLGEEALDFPGAGYGQFVLFGQFVHPEDGDDVLKRLVALEDTLHV